RGHAARERGDCDRHGAAGCGATRDRGASCHERGGGGGHVHECAESRPAVSAGQDGRWHVAAGLVVGGRRACLSRRAGRLSARQPGVRRSGGQSTRVRGNELRLAGVPRPAHGSRDERSGTLMPYAALLLFQHAYDPGAPVHGAPWLWFTILKIIVVFTVIMVGVAMLTLAPVMSFVPALLTFAVIPFAAPLRTPWGVVNMSLADAPIGFLYILAIASLGVYGIVLAGW